jgi:hypothetical protein
MVLKTSEFPQFLAEVQALGLTDAERAKALGVKNGKTVERLRQRIPKPLDAFARNPQLLRALLADLDAERAA